MRKFATMKCGVAALLLLAMAPAPAAAHVTVEAVFPAAPPPFGREGAAGAFIDGLFYMTHGFAGGGIGDTVLAHAYDPVLNAWTNLTPANCPRSEVVGVAAPAPPPGVLFPAPPLMGDIVLYVIGGRSNPGCVDPSGAWACFPGTVCAVVEVYDPALDAWYWAPPMPTPRAGSGAVFDGTLISVVGGRTGPAPYTGFPLAAHEVFDPAFGAWGFAPALPIPAADVYSTVFHDGLMHVIGGNTAGFFMELPDHQVYDPTTGAWALLAPLPVARSNAIAGVCYDHIYVLGGSILGANQNLVDKWEPAGGGWLAATPLPLAASELAAGGVSQEVLGPYVGLIMAAGTGIFGAAGMQNFQYWCF